MKSKAINRLIGEVKNARILRNGSLLVECRDSTQQGKAIRLNKFEGKSVSVSILENKQNARGVISGVPLAVSMDQIKGNVTGATVVEARRLRTTRNGEKCDSLSVMIRFEEEQLPTKVYLGYMSYNVRPYVPPPLRCFKCQKYGHIAAVCKGKQRCARCAGEHEYGKCERGAQPKCCNCGGEHSSAYRGCEVSKRAVEVQKVRVEQGVTYAEAARRVQIQPVRVRQTENSTTRPCEGCSRLKTDTLIVKKTDFVLFMVEVINCSAQTERKTEKIKIIVKAAERFLGVRGLGLENIENMLGTGSSQSQSWGEGSPWS